MSTPPRVVTRRWMANDAHWICSKCGSKGTEESEWDSRNHMVTSLYDCKLHKWAFVNRKLINVKMSALASLFCLKNIASLHTHTQHKLKLENRIAVKEIDNHHLFNKHSRPYKLTNVHQKFHQIHSKLFKTIGNIKGFPVAIIGGIINLENTMYNPSQKAML